MMSIRYIWYMSYTLSCKDPLTVNFMETHPLFEPASHTENMLFNVELTEALDKGQGCH